MEGIQFSRYKQKKAGEQKHLTFSVSPKTRTKQTHFAYFALEHFPSLKKYLNGLFRIENLFSFSPKTWAYENPMTLLRNQEKKWEGFENLFLLLGGRPSVF